VVIGGAFGIGLATARRFAAEGANVVIADLDDEQAAVLDLAGPDAVLLGTPTADSSHLAPRPLRGHPLDRTDSPYRRRRDHDSCTTVQF
jgi:NAD(P)-dependent dehydrogenase (short-subunit alcohol dehydrogenase family)